MKDCHKYFKYISTFFVVFPTTFIMSSTSHLFKHTYSDNFITNFIISWFVGLPVAYLAVLLLIPLANKLTGFILKNRSTKN
jgi:Protein of unknown function (DUF2798)